MASFASSATTGGACKHAWAKKDLLSLSAKYTIDCNLDKKRKLVWVDRGGINHIWLYFTCAQRHTDILYKKIKILQGLGVAKAAVTERWPWKEEKTPDNQGFFFVKRKLYTGRFKKNHVLENGTICFSWFLSFLDRYRQNFGTHNFSPNILA